jgi:DNA-binding response OmpR family regulator
MNGAHVLVVDDDPDILEVVGLTLSASGYRVSRARNGREALALLAQELPQLILLDIKMPVMDGPTFAAELRRLYDHLVPVLVLTASEDARRWARDVGADGWIPKPFDIDDLIAAVHRHTQAAARPGSIHP